MPVVILDDPSSWSPQQIELKQQWDTLRVTVARRNLVAILLTFIMQSSIELLEITSIPYITMMKGQEATCIMHWVFKIRELLQELSAFSMRAILLVEITQHIVHASILAADDAAITAILNLSFIRNHEASFYSWSRAAELIHNDISSQHTRALTSRWVARERLEHLHQEMDALFQLEGDLDPDERT